MAWSVSAARRRTRSPTFRLRLGDGLSINTALLDLDGDVRLEVGERVRRLAAETDHAIGRFF